MATLFAATYPERVSHLILFGSSAREAWAPDFPEGQTREAFEEEVRTLLANWGKPFPLEDGAPSVAHDEAAKAWFSAYLRFSASPRAAEQITRLNYELDIREIAPAVSVPTLVLHRKGDRWVDVSQARHLAGLIPHAELRLLPGDDHIQWYGDQDGLIVEVEEFVTGERATSAADRALLTVVFIDIVGSTKRLAAMGDGRWQSVLNQLDVSVGRRVQAHRGKQVKHTGDGYLLAFTGPTRAIECAKAVRRDAERLGLACKTGIHSGECERRGDDLGGMAVHIAARIMAVAEPQSIATSQTVKDLVIGSEHEFTRLDISDLRDVPGEWTLYSVSA